MLPEWDLATGNLPEGIHRAEWDEVKDRLGFTPYRRQLLQGLAEALSILRAYGCQRVWVDGSFITDKPEPGDFDCCWDYAGVGMAALRAHFPVFFDFADRRRAQKERFGGEFFLAHHPADLIGTLFLDFFQTDKHTGDRKGIILIDLPAQGDALPLVERS